MATITASPTGGNWVSTGTWTGGVVPTAADDVLLDATSGNVTVTGGAACRSLDCTGYTGTLTHPAATTLAVGDSTAGAGNVAVRFSAGMTVAAAAATSLTTYVSTATTPQTVTYAGKTTGNVTFTGPGATWTLQDPLTTIGAFTVQGGTLDTGGNTVTCATAKWEGVTAVVTLGASTVAFTATTGTLLSVFNGATLNAGTSNLVVATASATDRTVSFSGRTAHRITYTVPGSTGALILGGAGTAVLTLYRLSASDTATTRTVRFWSGITTHIVGDLDTAGAFGNRTVLRSSTSGTPATLSKTSGVIATDHVSLQDLTATGGASWYAGGNSNNVSGNTGWLFVDRPTARFLAIT